MKICKPKHLLCILSLALLPMVLIWDVIVEHAAYGRFFRPNISDSTSAGFLSPDMLRTRNNYINRDSNFTKANRDTKGNLFLQMNRIRGRMGNWMFQYASLVGIATRVGYQPYLAKNFPLSRVFDLGKTYTKRAINSVIVHPQEEILCFYNETFFEEIDKIGNRNITLKGWFWSERYFKHMEDQIRRVFTFKKHVYDSLYKRVPEILLKNRTNIGVHVRRTDRWKDESKRGLVLFDQTYLHKAMTYFRQKYKNSNPLFFVVTDDLAWTKKHVQGSDVIYRGSKSAVEDMALLASCDHVIMTMGTFGWWGGWLSKGDVIYHYYRFCNDTQHYFLPSWIPMTND